MGYEVSIDWRTLVLRLEEQRCTPFIGAAVSQHLFPAARKLAKDWIDRFQLPIPGDSRLDYVAQMVSIKTDPMAPKEELAASIRKSPRYDPTRGDDPFTRLANLSSPLYITTNYDNYMEQALLTKGVTPRTVLCPWNHSLRHLLGEDPPPPTTTEPWVYHLHGYFEEPDSMVLTEDDYTEFLVNVWRSKDHILQHRIQRALANTMLLLVGYGLKDITFRVLFKGMIAPIEKTTRRNGLTVQMANPLDVFGACEVFSEERMQHYLDLNIEYFRKMEFNVYWGDLNEFLAELERNMNAASAA